MIPSAPKASAERMMLPMLPGLAGRSSSTPRKPGPAVIRSRSSAGISTTATSSGGPASFSPSSASKLGDMEGGHVGQHGPRPGGQLTLGVVDQRAERPAELRRQRDRPDALDQELAVPLALAAVADQCLELLEPGVP